MKIMVPPPTFSLLAHLPSPGNDEVVDPLLLADGIRLERIVSCGHASPPGFWYEQSDAEWVVVVSGRAHLAIEGEPAVRDLGPGDAVYLPAGCRHRVAWTDPARPTVWLALFVDVGLRPRCSSWSNPPDDDQD